MEDKEAKRDLFETFRKMVELAMPNLRHYYRMARKGKIVGVYASDGQYFADVQPLRNDETVDENEPVVPRVALPVLWGGPDRGVVCPPQAGTLCDLAYYDGDPNYPYISNIRWGMGKDAPLAELNEFVIQLENGCEIRIDKEKQVVTLTPENVRTKAGKVWTVEAKEVLVRGAEKVTLEAPEIFQNGNVTTAGQGGASGTVDETANRTQRGNLTIKGNLSVSGDIDCSGTSTAASRAGAPI